MTLYIGIMSGTSLDAVDAVAVEFLEERAQVLGSEAIQLPNSLKEKLLSLCSPGFDEINRSQHAANELSVLYAQVVKLLLNKLGKKNSDIRAIGAHGQTVRHNPQFQATTQLINGSLLAELTGIDTVVDFRNRDIAAAGQGAPLVPAFHFNVFAGARPRAVVNIGGISNVTYLKGREEPEKIFGFDCGPGNMLMDAWIQYKRELPYDKDGQWAVSGKVNLNFLSSLMSEPYIGQKPPKSTGRELFNIDWLQQRVPEDLDAADVQRTLVEFTALSIYQNLANFCDSIEELFVCGGGALNPVLMEALQQAFAGIPVKATDVLGIDTQAVEGAAFAWLAKQFIERKPGNVPAVTGAKGFRVLGCLYPA